MSRRPLRWLPLAAVIVVARLIAQPIAPPTLSDAMAAFDSPPDAARPMMRWWWFGPAVDASQIARDLDAMKRAGLGGAEIQPVYPLRVDDPVSGRTNARFLSDEFLDALRVAGQEAATRGLRLDLTLGSGWPYGGATVGVSDAASRLRLERIVVAPGTPRLAPPAIGPGERWVGAFVGPDGDGLLTALSMTPLPWSNLNEPIALPPSPRTRQVWQFVASRTGMQVKRPSLGAEGYVLNHYDRAALDRYLDNVGAKLLAPFGARPPFAIFCDSLEVYDSDWSPDMLAEFTARRGYDIRPWLPALAADRGVDGGMVREDWGRTLSELLDERFIAPLASWARAHGTQLRMQGYGIPPATISSNAPLLPEGEGHQWRELTATRWASSAAHLFDKPVASSETWTWLHSPSFRATPLDLKAEADRHFLQGITQLIGHGWPSTPEGEAYPGWRFYAAAALNERNPWWIVMPDVSTYLQRVSAVLRLGRPGNDVALYVPTFDAYAHASLGRMHLLELARERVGREIIGSILDAGYGVDLIDDAALGQGHVDGDVLVVGAGRYRAVVVPGVEAMPEATLARLEQFAERGVVIATRRAPMRPPGRTPEEQRRGFAARVAALFARPDGHAAVTADEGMALRRTLAALVSPPIRVFSAEPTKADAIESDVGVIERRLGDESVFFVANTSNVEKRLRVDLRSPNRVIGLWTPLDGRKVTLKAGGTGAIRLTLSPYGSSFIVRTSQAGDAGTASADIPSSVERVSSRPVGPWTVRAGDDVWSLSSESMTGWEQREGSRYFSGVVVYETTVTLTAADIGRRITLDFGEGTRVPEYALRNGLRAWLDPPIREAAVVEVNGGRLITTIWAPPFRADITAGVAAGDNHLRIRVGNTAMNAMAGQSPSSYRLLNLRYGERFVPQDMDQVQVLPSGIVAPVKLLVTD